MNDTLGNIAHDTDPATVQIAVERLQAEAKKQDEPLLALACALLVAERDRDIARDQLRGAVEERDRLLDVVRHIAGDDPMDLTAQELAEWALDTYTGGQSA